jgi:hypothetical protein
MAVTVGCKGCGWTTDIELTSETNPCDCPKCGGDIYISGQDELSDDPLYGDDGELNPILLPDDEDY